ncbi:MAG: N-substituted formamide deformylase precursor, partial [Bacteroidota bacterium]
MKIKILLGALLGATFLSCTQVEQVDTLLYNATFYTLDSLRPTASVLAIKGDRIVAVGDRDLLDRFNASERIDLNGGYAYPGL